MRKSLKISRNEGLEFMIETTEFNVENQCDDS
jgi:hypothetical protein